MTNTEKENQILRSRVEELELKIEELEKELLMTRADRFQKVTEIIDLKHDKKCPLIMNNQIGKLNNNIKC